MAASGVHSVIHDFSAHDSGVACLALGHSSKAQVFATGGHDGVVNLWRVGRPAALLALEGHKDSITSLAFDRKEAFLLCGAAAGSARVFDLGKGAAARVLRCREGAVVNVQWHPTNANYISTASSTGEVQMWDLRTKANFISYADHKEGVTSAAFSPDGRWLMVGAGDGCVSWWDLTKGQRLLQWEAFTAPVVSTAFHPTDFYLAATSASGDLAVLGLDNQSTLATGANCGAGAHPRFLGKGEHLLTVGAGVARTWALSPSAQPDHRLSPLDTVTGGWGAPTDVWAGRRRAVEAATGATYKRHTAVMAAPQGQHAVVAALDVHSLAPYTAGRSAPATPATEAHPSKSTPVLSAAQAASVPQAAPSPPVDAPASGMAAVSAAVERAQAAAASAAAAAAAGRLGVAAHASGGKSDSDSEGKEGGGEDAAPPDEADAASTGSGSGHSSGWDGEAAGEPDTEDEEEEEEEEEEEGGGSRWQVYRGPALPSHPGAASRLEGLLQGRLAGKQLVPVQRGDKPIGLDFATFLPQAPQSSLGATMVVASLGGKVGATAVGKLSGQERARKALRAGHSRPASARRPSTAASSATGDKAGAAPRGRLEHAALAEQLTQRLQALRVMGDMWSRGDVSGTIAHIVQLGDHAVAADFLGQVRPGAAGITLASATALVPLLRGMLTRHFQEYVKVALKTLRWLASSFAPLLRDTLRGAKPASIGVDLAVDGRLQRCVAAFDALEACLPEISAVADGDGGAVPRLAQDLERLLHVQLFDEATREARQAHRGSA